MNLTERANAAQAKINADKIKQAAEDAVWAQKTRDRIHEAIPNYVDAIMKRLGEVADAGGRNYQHILWDDKDDYTVKDEIVAGLQEKGVTVETEKYISPGSYGDGETFIRSSSRWYLNCSW